MPRGTRPASQPKDLAQRAVLATKCIQELKLTLPVLLDDMSGTAERAYHGWPDRICIIDVDGKVAYPGRRGPGGFKPAEAEKVLKQLVANKGRLTTKAAGVRPSSRQATRPASTRPARAATSQPAP